RFQARLDRGERRSVRAGVVRPDRRVGLGRRQQGARQQARPDPLVQPLHRARGRRLREGSRDQDGAPRARPRDSRYPLGSPKEVPVRSRLMYQRIYVPVDNSDYSNRAVDAALELGRAFQAKLTGCHVYAASMHDYRFKQMEYTLPEEYLDETELERQRKIHDSLITMGLKLISESSLDWMANRCNSQPLHFTP